MRSKLFNTPFENMLRILLLLDVLGESINIDRLATLDFICIYGKKCKALETNLHGDNEFGFSEFTSKRERISEAVKLAVVNGFIDVVSDSAGLLYKVSDRGKEVIKELNSPYSRTYVSGAKIVKERFKSYSDESLLKYISNLSTSNEEGDKCKLL